LAALFQFRVAEFGLRSDCEMKDEYPAWSDRNPVTRKSYLICPVRGNKITWSVRVGLSLGNCTSKKIPGPEGGLAPAAWHRGHIEEN